MALYGKSERSLLGGTVTLTSGSVTVTGSGTLFSSEVQAGTELILSGIPFTVRTVVSNTDLRLTEKWYATGASAIGFALENGTIDAADSTTSSTDTALETGRMLLDGSTTSGDVQDEGDVILNETQTSVAGIQISKREVPKSLSKKDKASTIGVNAHEMKRSADNLVTIKFGANTNSGGSGGSGYTGQPAITVAAPSTFTFDATTADTDGDGELTVEDSGYGGYFSYTNHGFEMGTAVVYNDGGGTVVAGLTEGNVYHVIPRPADPDNTFHMAVNYGGIELEGTDNLTIMLEDGTVDSYSGSEAVNIGDGLAVEWGGPVDTTSATTIADTGFVNMTAVGAGTAHTLIGVTGTATAIYEETRIRLEDGSTDDNSGEFLRLDGYQLQDGGEGHDNNTRDYGEFLLMGGGGTFIDSDVAAGDRNADFVVGHLGGVELNLVGTSYNAVPTITVAAPPAKTFNASSAVDGANITIANHGLQLDDAVTYSENSGTAISELTDGGTYYVVSVSGDDIQLSSSKGGDAITLTDGSSENHTLTGETASATAVLGPGSSTASGVAHTGWSKVTVGTGGRAGRVFYETLVAGPINGDAGSVSDAINVGNPT